MNKKFWFLLAIAFALAFVLGACADNSSSDDEDKNDEAEAAEDNNENDNGGDDDAAEDTGPQDGGTLTYALDAKPDGVFNINFYGIATDGEVIDFFDDGLIKYDEELKPLPNIASWETEDNQVYHFTFEEGVKWHNGEELTVDDWVFALETLADEEYTGSRYGSVANIEGAPDYHAGDADEISGLNVINDYEIEITFDQPRVNNLENLWTNPMSRKEFEGVEVADMEESDQVRKNPIGTGPFKVTKIIPGESVELEAFDDYWQGTPHLDKIIIKVIDPSLVVGELEKGSVDMTEFHPSNYEEIQQNDNVEILESMGLSYYYVGFRLGTWDGETNTMDYEKYQNKELRQAMAYALDREAWIDEFFFGLGDVVNRPVPSSHWIAADNSEMPHQYDYDPEKAKELLDEAGYVDVDGDDLREDPDGNEFVVQFGHYATGNPTFEARAKAITQFWNDVGIATELAMTDSQLYYEQIEEADESVEVFFGGWSTGADPDPTQLWASNMMWNYPRWVNEENDQLLEDALDIEALGDDVEQRQEKRKEIYKEWQSLVNEELPMIPIAELTDVLAVNKNVQDVTLDLNGTNPPHEWWIKQD